MSATNFNVDSLNAFMTHYTTTIRDNNYYGDNIKNEYENYKYLKSIFFVNKHEWYHTCDNNTICGSTTDRRFGLR